LAGKGAADVANLVKSWNPDFIITTGDNNYFDGSASIIDQNVGQYYHDFIHPYVGSYGAGSSINRFFPSLGNHDWGTPGAKPYLDYFTLPGNERYYDFTWGPVHFFAIDSDFDEPDGVSSTSTQAQWLQSALGSSTVAWKLVYMHHPPYSSGPHGSSTRMQWPYQAWGVDAVLVGHDHVYERIIRNGFPYFVNGLGGSARYSFGTPISGSQVRYNADHGAMLVEATPTTITFQFISRAGEVIDTYSLQKDDPQNNQAPVVNAGQDQTTFFPALASLDGTVSDDGMPNGSLKIIWTQVSGPGSVTFGDAFAVDTTASFSAVGTYILRCEADDGEFQVSDDVTVTVEFGSGSGIELIMAENARSSFALGNKSENARLSQSFQAAGPSLQGVSVALAQSGNPAYPIQVSIRHTLNGADLTSTTITPALLSSNYREPTWLSAAFPTPLAVVPGETYYLTLSVVTIDSRNFYRWSVDKLNPYPDGNFYRGTTSLPDNDALAKIQFGAGGGGTSPSLAVSPDGLAFGATVGGPVPPSQALTISNEGAGTLRWDATVTTTDGGAWLAVSPSSGAAPSTPTVTITPFGLAEGLYQGAVTVEAEAATNSPQSIPVTLVIDRPPTGSETLQPRIARSEDDSMETSDGTVKLTAGQLFLGRNFLFALRLVHVTIPQGAVIESAMLQMYVSGNAGKSVKIRYQGEATGDSAPHNPVPGDLSSRPTTAAFVDDIPEPWTVGKFNPSPELRSIIQEIIDHPDWVSGSSLTLFIADNGSSASRTIGTFESQPSPTKAAILTITYSE
jgi:hypothetical protein